MVGSGYVVKLGDFGMARAMYDSDYYRFGRKGKANILPCSYFMRYLEASWRRGRRGVVGLLDRCG